MGKGLSDIVQTAGSGKIWLDELHFEVVDKTVPLTGLIDKPQNLNFTE